MMTIGVSEARIHFSKLLKLAAGGEQIVITRRGKTVAVLQPRDSATFKGVEQVIEDMRHFRKDLQARGVSISREEIREWTQEGR